MARKKAETAEEQAQKQEATKAKSEKKEFALVEETTRVVISSITEKEFAKVQNALKGQVHNSNDLQLRAAINGYLGRAGISAQGIKIERNIVS